MLRRTIFLPVTMVMVSASFAQTAPEPLADEAVSEPATVSFEDALVAALKETIEFNTDPIVEDFVALHKIPADQLFKQDNGYFLPPPQIPPQPAVPLSPQIVAAFEMAGASQTAIQRQRATAAQTAAAGQSIAADQTTLAKTIIRPHYSKRRKLSEIGTPSPSTDRIFTDWYRAQLPEQLWPGSAGSPAEYNVLYLSECWADDLPAALEAALGGDIITANDRPAIDRAQIEIALNRAGLDFSLSQSLSVRVTNSQRTNADPAIRQINDALWAAYQAGQLQLPTVVLEKYCGTSLRKAYAMMIGGGSSYYYRVAVPENLVGTYFAPFFYAEVCRKKTGSRYLDQSCKKWQPLQSGDVLSGLGRYRLVGMNNDETVSYQYVIRGSSAATTPDSPQNIKPTLEQ